MNHSKTIALVLALAVPLALSAQGRPQGRRGRAMQQMQDSGPPPDRAALEERVRQRFAQVLRNRLGLTDEQMTKVRDVNLKYAGRRRTLLDQERDIRMSLREAIVAADSSNQQPVAKLLDRMMTAQRQRIDLLEQEQKDLSSVLTPLQRASYMGLEEQLRQGIEGMRGGRGGRRGGPPPDGGNGNGPAAGRRGPPPAVPPDGRADKAPPSAVPIRP